jgi:hypothetical protein
MVRANTRTWTHMQTQTHTWFMLTSQCRMTWQMRHINNFGDFINHSSTFLSNNFSNMSNGLLNRRSSLPTLPWVILQWLPALLKLLAYCSPMHGLVSVHLPDHVINLWDDMPINNAIQFLYCSVWQWQTAYNRQTLIEIYTQIKI